MYYNKIPNPLQQFPNNRGITNESNILYVVSINRIITKGFKNDT
jgi:hypothetical protein